MKMDAVFTSDLLQDVLQMKFKSMVTKNKMLYSSIHVTRAELLSSYRAKLNHWSDIAERIRTNG